METHYNDALEKAKQAIIDCGSNAGRKEMIYGIFPELREWGEAEAASATDEKIRKELSAFLWNVANGSVKSMPSASMCQKWAVYLNKQKAKEQYDRLAPIYAEQESFESALDKAWKFYNDSGSSTVDGCEDNAFELAFAKGFREGFLYKKSQKKEKAVPLDDDTRVGLDRALHIVTKARGVLVGYRTDDGVYECDSAIVALQKLLGMNPS